MTKTYNNTPGMLRLIAAFCYDLVLLFGLLLLSTTIVVLPVQSFFGVENIGQHPLFRLLLLFIIVIFYLWFWTHGGQTLGMRAWRIKLTMHDGEPLGYLAAIIRFLMGSLLFGITLTWMLFDHEGQTLHDKIAKTRLHLLPKKAR